MTRSAGNRTPIKLLHHRTAHPSVFWSFTAVLPAHWANMENSLFKQVNLPPDSVEYNEVEQKISSKGCSLNIVKVGSSLVQVFHPGKVVQMHCWRKSFHRF